MTVPGAVLVCGTVVVVRLDPVYCVEVTYVGGVWMITVPGAVFVCATVVVIGVAPVYCVDVT